MQKLQREIADIFKKKPGLQVKVIIAASFQLSDYSDFQCFGFKETRFWLNASQFEA